MAPTHDVDTRNVATDAVTALFNSGTIEFRSVTDVEIATLSFGSTAFAAASAGVATANAITSDSSATGGTTTKFVLIDSASVDRITGTVTGIGGGGNCEATDTVIPAGAPVAITDLQYGAIPS